MVDGLQLFIILNILIIAFEIYYGKDEYIYIYIYIYILMDVKFKKICYSLRDLMNPGSIMISYLTQSSLSSILL